MSNVLRRKQKKADTIKNEFAKRENEKKMLLHLQEQLNFVVLFVAHDRLGFGRKRILRLTNEINQMINGFSHGILKPSLLADEIEKRFGLEMFEKSKSIPLRVKVKVFGLGSIENAKESQYMQLVVNGSFEAMFNMVIHILHRTFKLSKTIIIDFIDNCFYHINLVYKGEFTISDMREQLLLEIGIVNKEG